MDRKIDGPTLVGFTDFFVGGEDAALVGAARPKPAPKPVKPGKPGVKTVRVQVKRNDDVSKHAKVMATAKNVAAKSVKTLSNAAMQLKKYTAAKKGGMLKTAVGAAVKALPPKAQAAVKKHTAAVARADKTAKSLAVKAIQARRSTQELAKKMVMQQRIIKTLRTPIRKRTSVRGIFSDPVIGAAVAEAFQDYYTAIGAAPDPNNPGFLDDGSNDPAYRGDTGTGDMDMGLPLDGAEPTTLPTPPSMDTVIADMSMVGGIAYDNSKGTPPGFCGSVNYFNGRTLQNADVAQGMTDAQIAAAVFTAGLSSLAQGSVMVYGFMFGTTGVPGAEGSDTTHWIEVHGKPPHGKNWWQSHGGWEDTPNIQAKSISSTTPKGVPYGPLVGNPTMKDFAAMRVDARGQAFWFPQEAPDWLTFPIKQAAALTAQAAAKAQADADAAAAASAQQAAADAAVQQAQQDAANALAESQAASEQRVQETTSSTAAQQLMVQQAQLEQQQAQLEQQQATAEAEQERQANALILEQLRMEQAQEAREAAQAPPRRQQRMQVEEAEAEVEPLEEAEETGIDEEPVMDDGEYAPGGEIMLDEDGEGFEE